MPAQDPATVKLLTLLNVSSLKSKRRSLKGNDSSEGQSESDQPKRRKLGGKLVTKSETPKDEDTGEDKDSESESDGGEEANDFSTSDADMHSLHFGTPQEPTPAILTPASRSAIDSHTFVTQQLDLGAEPEELGAVVSLQLEAIESEKPANKFSSLLASYRDVMLPYIGTSPKEHDKARRQICDHIVEHLQRHRKRIMANNARLLAHSKAAAATTEAAKSGATGSSKTLVLDPPSDVRDQGFTRPTVLILLPFRNSAVALVDTLASALQAYQDNKSESSSTIKTENYSRFQSEYGLPSVEGDKLLNSEPGTYPSDHVRNFAGNIDDAFRLGIRLSNKGKGWRLFSGFLGSDIIVASPLGLRMGIEREGPPDFLSSLEIMLIDQLDCLTMQNWTHLTHILEFCNVLPKEAHGADFARVREYCLDGHSRYLRQTVLLSSFETPQVRALFNSNELLKNVAGRVRQTRQYGPISIPEGLALNWVKLDCDDPAREPDVKFEYFKDKIVPNILNPAQAQTLIFVPSYFDYLRIYNHLASYASSAVIGISEYKIRAVKHVMFYAPPDHAQFVTEILSFPFLDEDTAPAPSDVKVTCLYSKFDYMRLERIEGTKEAATMCAHSVAQP
ncbi:digestive organ expansion factor [Ceratobasidium theobromae]|uniref:U3 small nucleolar RNA-associated protein 25 n=1 Tax=Ceratobasidium theobromae TaxID=1582974 RepID=A0A5N5QLZ7_9AGAM|nr:digestive organ expansion factor [Ceratobasidium theobromae]